MLISTEKSITKIALDCGFNDSETDLKNPDILNTLRTFIDSEEHTTDGCNAVPLMIKGIFNGHIKTRKKTGFPYI